MRVAKPVRLGVLFRTYPELGKNRLAVAVLAMTPLGGARDLASEMALWTFAVGALGPGAVLDEGYAKVRGEVLVHGAAYAPRNKETRQMYCRVKVGAAIDKTLSVSGERYWIRDRPTQPLPFSSIPIDDAHAFGGPGHDQNPIGKGLHAVTTAAGELVPLPNIEAPQRPMCGPDERPRPEGFGPLSLASAARRELAGKAYDERWLETRFPGLAEDASPDFYQVARPDQRLPDGFFTGGEAVLLQNLHPDRPVLEASLPDLVARAILRFKGSGPVVDLAMHLETVHLFPDREAIVSVFRGGVDVADDDAEDVEGLVIGCESRELRRSTEHYVQVYDRRCGPQRDALSVLEDAELLPPPEAGWGATGLPDDEYTRASRMEGAAAARLTRRRERDLASGRGEMEAAGLSPKGLEAPPEEALPDIGDPAAVAKYLREATKKTEQMAERQKREQSRLEEEARKTFKELGMDWDAEQRKARREAAGPPKGRVAPMMEDFRGIAAKAREAGAPVPDIERMLADETFASRMLELERRQLDLYRASAHLLPAAVPSTLADSQPARARIQAARDGGEPLVGVDLTGCNLGGIDFRGMVLDGALLEGADLTGANLDGASLKGAVLARARLRGATFRDADLDDANLGDTDLEGAIFDGARLRRVVVMRSRFAGATFRGADLEGATFTEAVPRGADLRGARLRKVIFHEADLRGVDLSEAALEQSQFLKCNVEDASFAGADLTGTAWVETRGTGATFDRAKLAQAVLVQGSDFSGASFRDADMPRACLRESRFDGADFTGATMRAADLGSCSMVDAILERVDARGAIAVRADFRGASLRRACFIEVLASKADFRGSDLSEATFFRADLSRIRLDRATTLDAAGLEHALTRPLRESPADGEVAG